MYVILIKGQTPTEKWKIYHTILLVFKFYKNFMLNRPKKVSNIKKTGLFKNGWASNISIGYKDFQISKTENVNSYVR